MSALAPFLTARSRATGLTFGSTPPAQGQARLSDNNEGIKAAAAKVLKANVQCCRVHFMCNALVHAGKTQRRMVSAAIGTVFAQDSAEAARTQWIAEPRLESEPTPHAA